MSDAATDRAATAQAGSGPLDDGPLSAIVAAHEGPLLRYARQLVGAPADEAEDLVQEAFLRLHRRQHARGAARIENVKTWLFHVVHNLAMDTIRKRGRRQRAKEHFVRRAQEQGEHEDDAANGLVEMERREAAAYAVHLLDELPDPQRRVLILRLGHDMTIRQIAEVVGSTPGNVGYQLNRGLVELGRQLKQKGVI